METITQQEISHIHGDAIRVIVFSPRSPQPKEFNWRKTLRVGEAAREAATAFGYQGGNPGLQTTGNPPRVLDNNRTLAEEHVHNGEKLELIDTGGGVRG
jgi:hypothetical protein